MEYFEYPALDRCYGNEMIFTVFMDRKKALGFGEVHFNERVGVPNATTIAYCEDNNFVEHITIVDNPNKEFLYKGTLTLVNKTDVTLSVKVLTHPYSFGKAYLNIDDKEDVRMLGPGRTCVLQHFYKWESDDCRDKNYYRGDNYVMCYDVNKPGEGCDVGFSIKAITPARVTSEINYPQSPFYLMKCKVGTRYNIGDFEEIVTFYK